MSSGMSIIKPSMASPPRPSLSCSMKIENVRLEDVLLLYELPFAELIHRAQSVHRQHFDPSTLQLSTLLSVKTGGCPEDCAYCPQSRRYHTGVADEALL